MLRRMVAHTIDIDKRVNCGLSAMENDVGALIYISCANRIYAAE
jgi:hypothetical protein